MFDEGRYPDTAALTSAVLRSWPEHASYLERGLTDRAPDVMRVTEDLAGAVGKLAAEIDGGMRALCDDYRYMAEQIILPEELYFRRHGRYRLKTFEDADRECYANAALMTRYMNGLLVSNVIWSNHAQAFSDYVNDYLPRLPEGARHLEIGPGHGFFLHFAALSGRAASLTGWDVSATSVESTRHALATLGTGARVDLSVRNLFDAGVPAGDAGFDSIVMSEVLEHVEDPHAALRAVIPWLRPGGTMWINVPANSPAPDHIHLFRTAEEACEMVRACGLHIAAHGAFPISGVTLEKAVKRKQTISCVITAFKPH